ncbi:uncharacterized protein LOC101845209 [Aplysia californica]|uniref:Uncharacterized protein LOC101845209 n=1 Tax=Aplysia californica TaxID=6500 RepID=A0ABM0K9Y0_APLCA|nr:uncharacterized protein LOC101845209 [Aplysia californica]
MAALTQSEEKTWGLFSRYRRQTSGQDLGPTEEGTSISRTCAYNTDEGSADLVWEVQLAAVKRTAARCVTSQGSYTICTVSSGFSSYFSVTTDYTQTTLTWNADRRFLSVSCSQAAVRTGFLIASWTLVTYWIPFPDVRAPYLWHRYSWECFWTFVHVHIPGLTPGTRNSHTVSQHVPTV